MKSIKSLLIVAVIFFVVFFIAGGYSLVLFAALMATVFFWGAVSTFGQMKRLGETATTTVAHAQLGHVELIGRINAPPIVAPLSQRSCVYWELVLERCAVRGKNRQWRWCDEVQSTNDFLRLDDGTGVCWLCCDLQLSDTTKLTVDDPDKIKAALGIFDETPDIDDDGYDYRLTETCILPDSTLFAMGLFVNVAPGVTPWDNTAFDEVKAQGEQASMTNRWKVKAFGHHLENDQQWFKDKWYATLEGITEAQPSVPIDQIQHALVDDSMFGSSMPALVTDRSERQQFGKLKSTFYILLLMGLIAIGVMVWLIHLNNPALFAYMQ